MLISLEKLVHKYRLNIRGVLHVGAHMLEEQPIYSELDIKKIVWIEGNPEIYKKIINLVDHKNQLVFNQLISNVDDEVVTFHIANNGQSSSILNFKEHQTDYPQVEFVQDLVLKTKTLRSLFDLNGLSINHYNFLNLDIQGVELRAIKGLGNLIDKIDYIYTEVNVKQVYADNDLIQDIDNYLAQYGFIRAETKIEEGFGWGDAFYLRNKKTSALHQNLVDLAYKNTAQSNILVKVARRLARAII